MDTPLAVRARGITKCFSEVVALDCSLEIRPLQVETARRVARVIPGAVDGAE